MTCTGNCLQGRACTCVHMRDSAPKRWLQAHPESTADGIVLIGILLVAIVLFLSGCAGMLSSEPPPADWPKLEVVTISAPAKEMLAACAKLGVLVPGPACTLIDFDRKRCSIIFRDDRPMEQYVYDHEESHCKGIDDLGSDKLKRAWEKWKKAQ